MKEFDQQMYVATTTINGTIVDNPTEEQLGHNWVTKVECVNSGCPSSAEIRDASEPLNTCRYFFSIG